MELTGKLVGKCGIFCGACRVYILRKCKGCLNLYAKKEAECSYYRCVESKGVNSCGGCQEFPCLEHYGSTAVYAKKKLLDWKKREIARENQ